MRGANHITFRDLMRKPRNEALFEQLNYISSCHSWSERLFQTLSFRLLGGGSKFSLTPIVRGRNDEATANSTTLAAKNYTKFELLHCLHHWTAHTHSHTSSPLHAYPHYTRLVPTHTHTHKISPWSNAACLLIADGHKLFLLYYACHASGGDGGTSFGLVASHFAATMNRRCVSECASTIYVCVWNGVFIAYAESEARSGGNVERGIPQDDMHHNFPSASVFSRVAV